MKKLTDTSFLLTTIAIVELLYAATGLLTPPDMIHTVTGWVLTADGQWLTKLLGMALFTQAWVAWIIRKKPHEQIAKALAWYQIGAATIDWVMMIALADDGIFSNQMARSLAIGSVFLHYSLGLLLFFSLKKLPFTKQTGMQT